MSKLVPEVRIDKNGVPVTRHVNPDKKKKSASLPSPAAPSIAMSPERIDTVATAVAAISVHFESIYMDGPDEEWRLKYTKAFMLLSDETLQSIKDIEEKQGDVSFDYDCIRILVAASAKEQQYKHFFSLANLLADSEEIAENGPERAMALSLAMTEYDQYLDKVPVRDNDYSPYYRLLCEATMEMENVLWEEEITARYADENLELDYDHPEIPVTYRLILPDGDMYGSPVIRDPELVRLFIEDLGRGHEIIGLIKERKEFTPDILRGYLTSSHRSLSDGLI